MKKTIPTNQIDEANISKNRDVEVKKKRKKEEIEGLLLSPQELEALEQPKKEIEKVQLLNGNWAPIQEIISYMNPAPSKYEVRFITAFYKQIFKLNGWKWDPQHKPSIIAKWTLALIYARFPKTDIQKILIINPYNEFGVRPFKIHQFLNEEGIRLLKQIINEAILLMEEFDEFQWEAFEYKYRLTYGLNPQTKLFKDKFNFPG